MLRICTNFPGPHPLLKRLLYPPVPPPRVLPHFPIMTSPVSIPQTSFLASSPWLSAPGSLSSRLYSHQIPQYCRYCKRLAMWTKKLWFPLIYWIILLKTLSIFRYRPRFCHITRKWQTAWHVTLQGQRIIPCIALPMSVLERNKLMERRTTSHQFQLGVCRILHEWSWRNSETSPCVYRTKQR